MYTVQVYSIVMVQLEVGTRALKYLICSHLNFVQGKTFFCVGGGGDSYNFEGFFFTVDAKKPQSGTLKIESTSMMRR